MNLKKYCLKEDVKLMAYTDDDGDLVKDWQPSDILIDEYKKVDSQDGYNIVVTYGPFADTFKQIAVLKNDLIVCAADFEIIYGTDLNLNVDKVFQLRRISTDTRYRNKGFAEMLYKYALKHFKIILSDDTFYGNAFNHWIRLLPKIGIPFNYNEKSKTFKYFDEKSLKTDPNELLIIFEKSIPEKLWPKLERTL
jgi:hypothetical protein